MKLLIFISIVFNLLLTLSKDEERSMLRQHVVNDSAARFKLEAFAVLQNSCNVCHEQRNRNAVFSLNNMNAWGAKINEQVFIKQRMPKGNAVVLTLTDKAKLKKWISTLK